MVSGTESSQLRDNFLFPRLFQAFRMAIQPTKLIIAFLAVAFICLAGWIMDFGKTVVTDLQGEVTELTAYMDNADDTGAAMESHIGKFKDKGGRTGVFGILHALAFLLGQIPYGTQRAVRIQTPRSGGKCR
jgi:hypothetical protein